MEQPADGGTARPEQVHAAADRATVEQVLAGDTEAFAGLLQRHQSAVYTHMLRMVRRPEDAMDLTQESFVKAFKHLAHYNPRWSFKTWLMTIATNTAINFIQKRRLQTVSFEEVGEPAAAPKSHAKEMEPALLAALARLPENSSSLSATSFSSAASTCMLPLLASQPEEVPELFSATVGRSSSSSAFSANSIFLNRSMSRLFMGIF